ncbi:hypothetical protein ACH50O_10955 [Methylomonas sp. 2BW1-5-20]|uniref:hypothetical protein n=1 Tax=Methylomonas sp. 2BW1-5-20 TaxID=3376686 RepID=UPI0040509FCF
MLNKKGITLKQLIKKTRQEFKLPKPFDPFIVVRKNYIGRWDIYNRYSIEFGITEVQKDYMLELIEAHGGFRGRSY